MSPALLVLGLLAAAGCEKLPWSSKRDTPQATASASPTTQASSAVPMKPPVEPNEILATVEGIPISKYDVELPLQDLKKLAESQKQPWKPLSHDDLEKFLDGLITDELMSQAALARGLDRNTETQRRWEIDRRTFFAREWLRWNQDRLEVSQAEVDQYYDQYKQGFRIPERRRLRQLTVAAEDQAKQALGRLLTEGASFATLAEQISIGQSAPQGGLLSGWIVKANEKALAEFNQRTAQGSPSSEGVLVLDPALEAAAFAIDQMNGLSNYVKGGDNRYHIFQLVERQPERARPLLEVSDEIKSFLLRQKVQQALDELRTKAKVERFSEHLEGVTQ